MKTTPSSLVLAGLWLPAVCLAAPERPPGAGPAEGEGVRCGPQPQFLEAWKTADTDGNGVISEPEFAAMKRIAKLPEEKRAELFKRLDKNRDGGLSRDEIGRLVRPQDGKHQMMPRLWELDKDKSGSISLEEFKAGEFVRKLAQEQQEALFRRLDVNRDGAISPQDHPAGPHAGPPGPPRDPRHFLRMLDKDGDGSLTPEEFQKAPFVSELDKTEQKERFDKSDRNKDGKIDASEFAHPEHKTESKPHPEPPRQDGGPK